MLLGYVTTNLIEGFDFLLLFLKDLMDQYRSINSNFTNQVFRNVPKVHINLISNYFVHSRRYIKAVYRQTEFKKIHNLI